MNRLPPSVFGRVSGVSLLGLSDTAAFAFHISSWLGGGGDVRHPTVPEIARMTVPVTCVHGADERDSDCLALKGPRVRVVSVGTGHHFGGDYTQLVDLILRPAASRWVPGRPTRACRACLCAWRCAPKIPAFFFPREAAGC